MLSRTRILALAGILVVLLTEGADQPAFAQQTVRSVEAFQPKIKWGGRSVAIAQSGRINSHAIVASESGGLFKTTDMGSTWRHLDGLPPFRMADVKYARVSAEIVIATALRDSKVINRGGIWRSTDGGEHWRRPATADPAQGPNCPDRVSAFGISFQPSSNNVYVGTTCGLAVSRDLGETWEHMVIDAANPAVFSVVATRNGRILVCGAAGVRMFSPQTQQWARVISSIDNCRGGATHTVDFSETAQSFVVTNGFRTLFKSDDQGNTWTALPQPSSFPIQSRATWVRWSPPTRNDSSVDLYFGDGVELFRTRCNLTNPGLSCDQSWQPSLATGHSDPNDIAFITDECPHLVVTDGGVHKASECGAVWTNVGTGGAGFNALQIYHVDGQILPSHTDLYFGTQDNGLWASALNGLTWPSDPFGNEGFGFVMERYRRDHGGRIIAWMQSGGIFSTTPHFASNLSWGGPPGNTFCTPAIVQSGVHFQFANIPNTSTVALYLTTDDGGRWRQVLTVPYTLAGCMQLSGPASKPIIYQPVTLPGSTSGGDPLIGLIRIIGTIAAGPPSVSRVNLPASASLGVFCPAPGAFDCPVVYAANPDDPGHLIVPDVVAGHVKVSHDGGQTWSEDTKLTELVTARGSLRFNIPSGEEGVRLQVHAIAFDPDYPDHILIGTEEAGIIETFDGGSNWSVIDFSSRVTGVSSFFFDRNNTVIVSTYGRGLWKVIDLPIHPPRTCLNKPRGCSVEVTEPNEERVPRGSCPHWPDLPTCQVITALDGRIRDFSLDTSGNVERIFFDGDPVGAFSITGEEVTSLVPLDRAKVDTQFSNCPACVTIEKRGGAVRGLILGKSKLIGIVAEYPEPSIGDDRDAPYVQVMGKSFASGHPATPTGEELTVYGSGFCRGPNCPGVTLLLNGRVVVENVRSEPYGMFKAEFVVKELPGFYLLTASQRGPAGETLSSSANVVVPISESEEQELFQRDK